MSHPGQKPAASPRPRRSPAARHTQEHVNVQISGSPSNPGGKKESDEKKAASLGTSQPSRTSAGRTAPTAKVSASLGAPSKFSSMNPTETKAVKTEPEKSQSTKPSVVPEKKSQEGKPEKHTEPKSLPKHASDKGSKHARSERAVSRSSEQVPSEKPMEQKTKPQDTISAGGESVAAGVAAASGRPGDKKKEEKPLSPAVPVESKLDKPSGKSGLDAALDDLIDTLGEPEETKEDSPTYTGPEVSDPMSSAYIEGLGKREVTIPPKYRELLAKPMGPEDAIDVLSSDFTCGSPTVDGMKTEKEKSTGEVLKAQSLRTVRTAAPPQEKKRKVEKDTMSDQALEALSASLGTQKPEPKLDLSSVTEVDEVKAKEERLEKCGEDEETVPSEYRLQPAMDKDGKPLLPQSEEKPKLLSESQLIDELSEDFDWSKCKEKRSKPTEKTEESKVTAPTSVAETVPRISMCSIQSAPPKSPALQGQVPEDAVEALAGSLGEREADREDEKPVIDKVTDKAKEEDCEKLGEKEETIPPDYRLEDVKDEDGKPLLPTELKEQLPPLREDVLLDTLSEDFSSPLNTSSLKFEDAKLSAVISEVVSQTPGSATHSGAPPPDKSSDKEIDDALNKLSDSLGQRQPDPDENKPMEDKVKEKAKAEHRDKLGERDDTLPPDYRHLLDGDGKDKPAKPPTNRSQESKNPTGNRDPVDVLSGDFDSCPSTTETSQNTAKDKSKKAASSSKAAKKEGKAKDSAKTTEGTSKPKTGERDTS
ncbi:calpastatin isoform X2 [Otolemur garnettii]|uniref:calpastatin isoform X2 n=1 Tax=Otolemur garnettii TaxID=30611 RepID=UPI0006443667|nr:calpastatin isoform X2 [Otolemur garnettii]